MIRHYQRFCGSGSSAFSTKEETFSLFLACVLALEAASLSSACPLGGGGWGGGVSGDNQLPGPALNQTGCV